MDVLETLAARRSELEKRHVAMLAEAVLLTSEMQEIDTAIRVVGRTLGLSTVGALVNDDKQEASSRKTVRDFLLEKLRAEFPKGITATELVALAQKEGKELNPNTVSVTLGRIKYDGLARLEGRVWFSVPTDEEVPKIALVR